MILTFSQRQIYSTNQSINQLRHYLDGDCDGVLDRPAVPQAHFQPQFQAEPGDSATVVLVCGVGLESAVDCPVPSAGPVPAWEEAERSVRSWASIKQPVSGVEGLRLCGWRTPPCRKDKSPAICHQVLATLYRDTRTLGRLTKQKTDCCMALRSNATESSRSWSVSELPSRSN